MTKLSRRNFLKNAGLVGAGLGTAIAAGVKLPEIGQEGSIPKYIGPAQRPINEPYWYEIHHEISQKISTAYGCPASIWKKRDEAYNIAINLNDNLQVLGPYYNDGIYSNEAEKYYLSKFENLAIKARKAVELKLTQDDSGNYHLLKNDKVLCKDVAAHVQIVTTSLAGMENVCPRCLVLARENGIYHKDIVTRRAS